MVDSRGRKVRDSFEEHKEEYGAQEPLVAEVEQLLEELQPDSPEAMRQRAVEQLGRLDASHPRIVKAVADVKESCGSPGMPEAATEAHRYPVHQEELQEQPASSEGAAGERKATTRLPILALHVLAGFLGWYALTVSWCVALSYLGARMDEGAILLTPCLPVPWYAAALCLGLLSTRCRWLAAGALCALVVNTIGLIIRIEEVFFTNEIEWILGGWIPFFMA